ncbi:MAG: 50S ribosomal protein L11 methyltransferase [Gemmatimonadetes bacterium]|nr:50S ribosomal protein L11 methyltransferase [Gemmatimonadota bacterium]MBP7550577.1 50S ribosomal protein L11 methyltransferase [Gemmatimonadaceae bacterium]
MWHRVQITPSVADRAPAIAAAMFAAGAEGVHEDADRLVTHLPAEMDPHAFVTAVRAVDDALVVEHAALEDVDWSEKWRDRITSHQLGALTVTPPWLAEGMDPARTVVIEPAMAFGTGEHPTTRGVVRLMQAAIRPGDSVADLGAGSAILAIAAVKLGAARAFAIEMDHDSIANAEENTERNGVADRIAVLEGNAEELLPLVAPARMILANIISSVLLELLPLIAASLTADGQVILSGILLEERPRMLAALAAHGWTVEAEDAEDQWWSVRLHRARA